MSCDDNNKGKNIKREFFINYFNLDATSSSSLYVQRRRKKSLLKSTKNIYFSPWFSRLCFMLLHTHLPHLYPFHFTLILANFHLFWWLKIAYITFCHFMHFPFCCCCCFSFIIWWNNTKAFATLHIASFLLTQLVSHRVSKKKNIQKCRKALSLASQKRRIISYSI